MMQSEAGYHRIIACLLVPRHPPVKILLKYLNVGITPDLFPADFYHIFRIINHQYGTIGNTL